MAGSARLVSEVMADVPVVASLPEGAVEGLSVLVDVDGGAAGLVGPEGAGPAYAVAADTPVAAVVSSPDVLGVLVEGAPGIVVTREGRPVGVVTVQVLRDELQRITASVAGRQLGSDHTTYGERARPAPAARIRCGVCGLTNEFTRFSRAKTYRCRGGHAFRPYWQT
ncbi:hypothetical protein [Nonomuraea candida]|uniref:hypothetical protein n=1 Tax=Nonomuraea candida TaxID=359159 RepID=UPI000B035F90|nr:hypothetical protein [Nonomuraea candida]